VSCIPDIKRRTEGNNTHPSNHEFLLRLRETQFSEEIRNRSTNETQSTNFESHIVDPPPFGYESSLKVAISCFLFNSRNRNTSLHWGCKFSPYDDLHIFRDKNYIRAQISGDIIWGDLLSPLVEGAILIFCPAFTKDFPILGTIDLIICRLLAIATIPLRS
jgi:hypothetical protein